MKTKDGIHLGLMGSPASAMDAGGSLQAARGAFTLIEMLVVIGIMGLMTSLMLMSPSVTAQDRLDMSLRRLESTLLQARAMAMTTGYGHGVVFNIENAGDGKVFNNNNNTHWYQIVGPDKTVGASVTADATQPPTYPWGKGGHTNASHRDAHRYLEEFIAAMEASYIGERQYLESGIRFLALADEDPGSTCWATVDRVPMPEGHPFPRPWYGYYDETEGRLFTWGGYDPDIDSRFVYYGKIQEMSGFDYSEDEVEDFYDPSLDTNMNPAEVNGYISPEGYRYTGFSMDPADNRVLAGTPRPVIDARLADFMIVFRGDGSAFAAAFVSRGRNIEGNYKNRRGWLNSDAGNTINFESWSGRGKAQMTNLTALTGGYHITLARDIDPDSVVYRYNRRGGELTEGERSARDIAYERIQRDDVLKTLYPYGRLFVEQVSGLIEIKKADHPDCRIDVSSKRAYP